MLLLKDLDTEKAIIALTLQFHGHQNVDPTVLKPSHFADRDHRFLWELILNTVELRLLPSGPNVLSTAMKKGLDDKDIVQLLVQAELQFHMGAQAYQDYVKRILSCYRNRATLDALEVAQASLKEEESYDETIEALSTKLYQIQTNTEQTEIDRKKEITAEVISEIFDPTTSIVPTPYKALNDIVSGMAVEEFIILAARPGMGKTSVAVSIMCELADANVPVALFSMDMGRHQVWRRFLAYDTQIGFGRFKDHSTGVNKFDLVERGLIEKSRDHFVDVPLYVDASSVYSLDGVKSRIRNLVVSRGVRIVFIDHIGKIKGPKKFGRTEEVGEVARELKRFAKEFGITIVGLSQLNRAVESRGDGPYSHKRPRLSDLRDSGDIEQEADMVWMLYRPEYYKLATWEDNTPCQDQLEVMVEKNRDGAIAVARLRYHKSFGKVTDFHLPLY